MITKPCASCGGSGLVKERQKLNLKIPPGVETGSRLRLSGKGEGGVRGGPPGDLYVVIHVRESQLFKRQDLDIVCEIAVPFHIAALGGEVEIPTIHGFAKLKIPAGSETGAIFRLRGKGLPDPRSSHTGDQHIQIHAETPKKLNGKMKALLEQFNDATGESQYPEVRKTRKLAEQFYREKKIRESSSAT